MYVNDAVPDADRTVAARLDGLIIERRRIRLYREAYIENLRKKTVEFKELDVVVGSSFKAATLRPDKDFSLNAADLLAGHALKIDEVSLIATMVMARSPLVIPDPPKDEKSNCWQSFKCKCCGILIHIALTYA